MRPAFGLLALRSLVFGDHFQEDGPGGALTAGERMIARVGGMRDREEREEESKKKEEEKEEGRTTCPTTRSPPRRCRWRFLPPVTTTGNCSPARWIGRYAAVAAASRGGWSEGGGTEGWTGGWIVRKGERTS